MSASVCSCESCEKAKTTRSIVALLHELEQLVGPPELDAGELVALLERLVVDDADEADAVLGVQEVLACDQLADVAAADDDRVLDVGRAAPHDRCGRSRVRR